MQGDRVCGAGRRWCSELWRCSPKVAPNTTTTGLTQMADCDQCNIKFTLLRRRKVCGVCGLIFCGDCLKRSHGVSQSARRCNKCLVLTQWPLDVSEVAALRVKDLRHFLHSRQINTNTCTEKRDLIDLVTRHISSHHRGEVGLGAGTRSTTIPSRPPPQSQPQGERFKPQPHTSTTITTRDDGIRVRPSSGHERAIDRDAGNMGSIRVRPMDSIRVRPVHPSSPLDSPDYDPETDLGIRVFASDGHESHTTKNRESPGEDHTTTSCCSFDSCLNSQSPTSPQNGVVNIGFVLQPGESDFPDTLSQATEGDRGHIDGAVGGSNPGHTSPTENTTSPSAPPQEEQEQPALSSDSTSTTSSSSRPSATSSPEPAKMETEGSILSRIVALGGLKSEEDIDALSVRQCKELLTLHRVTYLGVREKSELTAKIKLLWKDYQNTKKDMESLPEELVCKICMDSAIDCVLLECGHMVACTPCGKQMSECPVCRQYVVRVVRTFRA